MSGNFRLHIPGVVFQISTDPNVEVVEQHPCYRDFINQSAALPMDVRVPVAVRLCEPLPDDTWPVVFDGGDSWLAFRDGDDLVAAFPSPTETGAFWWMARLGSTNLRVTVDCDPEVVERRGTVTRIANPLHYPLDQLLTMLILADRGGCIVHAAGVARGGRGIACIGRSGAGKTTLMGLLEGRTEFGRLSDDRVILRAGDPPLISGTPWSGEGMVAANQTATLAALVFLHQGDEHEVRLITPQNAAAQLLPTTSIPWFDEATMTGCLATLDALVQDTPAYDLVFRDDEGVDKLIEQIF